jgi:hypothetical protein
MPMRGAGSGAVQPGLQQRMQRHLKKAPAETENNWVQTIPDKGWLMILRLYGPLEPWFDQTWKPGEIELVN